ncbi:hypothetical protein [Janthinobacterium sp. MDB2-8]
MNFPECIISRDGKLICTPTNIAKKKTPGQAGLVFDLQRIAAAPPPLFA